MAKRQTPQYLPKPSPTPLSDYLDLAISSNYFKRVEQRKAYLEAFSAGANPLYICGKRKSGKTMFATELAYELTQDWEFGRRWRKSRERTYTFHYRTSIFKTICDYHIPGYVLDLEKRKVEPHEVDEQRFRDKCQLLRVYTPNDALFILDDVNGISITDLVEDPHYQELLSLGRLIIVTDDIETYPEHVIEPLPSTYLPSQEYDLSNYSPDERVIAHNAALIPTSGMNGMLFSLANGILPKDLHESSELWQLIPHSSQIVQPLDVPYSGSDADYMPFLDNLYRKGTQPLKNISKYDQICHCYKKAAYFLSDPEGIIARRAGELFKARGDLFEAFDLYKLFLTKQQARNPEDPVLLAEALFEVGCFRAYHQAIYSGDFSEIYRAEALEYFQRALQLQTTHLAKGHASIAMTRLAIAHMKAEEYDFTGATELYKVALTEVMTHNPNDYHTIAQLHIGAAGFFCGRSGRPWQREHAELALEIFEANNEYDEAYADACLYMEQSFPRMHADQRAPWIKKALETIQQLHPQKRQFLATLHFLSADVFETSKNYEAQANELKEVIRILEERLPPNHKRLLDAYQAFEYAIQRQEEVSQ